MYVDIPEALSCTPPTKTIYAQQTPVHKITQCTTAYAGTRGIVWHTKNNKIALRKQHVCVDQKHKTKKWKHRKGHEARKNPDDLHQGKTPPCEDQTKTNDIQPRTSNHSIASNHNNIRHTKSLPLIVSSSRSPAFFLPSRRRLHHAPAPNHQDSMCHVTTKTSSTSARYGWVRPNYSSRWK